MRGCPLGDLEKGQQQGYLSTATPGAENSSGFLGYVKDTRFSVDRGHFTDSFSLEISSETEGASIRYTTDGATPSEFEGILYTGPIERGPDDAGPGHCVFGRTTDRPMWIRKRTSSWMMW